MRWLFLVGGVSAVIVGGLGVLFRIYASGYEYDTGDLGMICIVGSIALTLVGFFLCFSAWPLGHVTKK